MNFDLTQLKKRFQSRSVLTLTIFSDHIAVSHVHSELVAELIPSLNLGIDAEKLLSNPLQAGAELATALETAGIGERRCVVCIPPSWALSASADLPEVSPEDLRGYFELRAEREFSASDLRLAHSPYSLHSGQQRATLTGVPAKRMEALEKMLETAGCRAVSISLALAGCLAKAEPTLHLLANSHQTDLVISSGGGIAAIRSLARPDASGLAAFAREIRITLGRLPDGSRQQLKHARLVGPQPDGLRESLEQMGFARIDEEPEDAVGAAVQCAGLFLSGQPVPFEFVIPEVNRWPVLLERINTMRGRQIAAGVVVLVLLPLLVFIIRSHMERGYEDEWNGMKYTVAELDGVQQKIRQFRPWFDPAPQKLKVLEALTASFPERGDVWTRSVQIAPFLEKGDRGARSVQSSGALKVTVSGFTRSQAAREGLQDRLGKQPGVTEIQPPQLRGSNPIQFTFTFKWESKHE